ncbi:MAG: 4Fe-4S dicluster domain-containing protein [Syntrophales bacterium]|jgi:adenylylsulfate reductase subunit B
MSVVIEETKCVSCGVCVKVCPSDVLVMEDKKAPPVVKYPYECWHCGACVEECPVQGAIQLRIPLPQMLLYK